jgi:UrcA family protein
MRPLKILMLAPTILAFPAGAESWRVSDNSYHIVARDVDQRSSAARAAILARVERAAMRLCEHEPLAADRRSCVKASISEAARRSLMLRAALAEHDAATLASR